MKLKDIKHEDCYTLFNRFSLQNPNENIKTFRLESLKKFTDMGLPGRKIEEYKDSKIQELLDKEFDLEIKGTEIGNDIKSHIFDDWYRIVIINGTMDRERSFLPDENIVEILPLEAFYSKEQNNSIVEAHLCTNSLYFLSTALSKNGVFIRAKKGKKLTRPLQILNISNTKTTFLNTKTLISIEEDASLEVIDHYIGMSSHENFINHTVDLDIQKKGDLQFYQLQFEEKNNLLIDYNIHIKESANFTAYSFNVGSSFSLSFWHVYLEERKAKAFLHGLVNIASDQRVGNIINIYHNAQKTESEQLFKQILKEKSKGIFYGKVVVSAEGKGTSAKQLSKTLLLSKEANIKINSKPHLEIYIDDLVASHGATVGNLDEDQIFYLTSRGIKKETAVKILVDAFQNELLEKIKDPQLSKYLHSKQI